MTNSPNSSGGQPGWHSKPWWTALGVIVAIAGLAVALGAWLSPRAPDAGNTASGTSSATMPPSSNVTRPSATTSGTTSTTASSSTAQQPADSDNVFLRDVPERNFIRQPSLPKRGVATIANQEYPSSYSYGFSNCGNCTYEVELNLPGPYKRFTGTFGLTDQTRHDKVIDGIVYVSIYSSTGAQLLASTKVEYPHTIPFDVDVTGVSRVRLTVSSGTNSEYPCWCDARFVK